ncbi:DNA topoisomerase I, mitochondrial isoform X4 [Lepisosteus oculatus]|uniref:DNA topoisomerase I, mitochondrial isoform X4 n=1 Tax=Lepisosteus oculatus TaxID=7918 RepID=UPI0035F52621
MLASGTHWETANLNSLLHILMELTDTVATDKDKHKNEFLRNKKVSREHECHFKYSRAISPLPGSLYLEQQRHSDKPAFQKLDRIAAFKMGDKQSGSKDKEVKAKESKDKGFGKEEFRAGGDVSKSKKVQRNSTLGNTEGAEKEGKGISRKKKEKLTKRENPDADLEDFVSCRAAQIQVKAEPEEEDFCINKKDKVKKRLREQEEPGGSLLESAKKKKKVKMEVEEAEQEPEKQRKKKKESKVKVEESLRQLHESQRKQAKKEQEGRPVSAREGGKHKKSKEEVEAAKALKIKKKEEEELQRWRWWEEEKYEDGIKWKFLEHRGPWFPAEYQRLPDNVKFYYDGKLVTLSSAAEEVAVFFAQMLDHEYTTKEVFRNNFFSDWRKEMTLEEKMIITDLNKCDFSEIYKMHKEKVEARKNQGKEEKQKTKDANQKLLEEYGYCTLDHHRERIGNFKIEPPGLFRGRGDHPKQGMLKKRIQPEDVIINCSKDSKIPQPPLGHQWKEVRCDNTVTWLASWTENVQGLCKYVMLNANSKLKGEKDWEKYEIARKLKSCVETIRTQYQADLKSKQMGIRQRAVALYFIDKVFKNLKLFMEDKQPGDDLFDRLNTAMLNKHLHSLMAGLTAKVFRTYNASITLQQQLKELTNALDNIPEKILSYNRANRAVAILCNHQRAPPKTFEQSMANLQAKIDNRKEQLSLAKKELKQAKKDAKDHADDKLLAIVEKKKKAVQRCEEQLLKLEVLATDKEENKQIALSTSKLNYLDPRISVAWCRKMEVSLEKIYNKTQRDKFAWAIDMTESDFVF